MVYILLSPSLLSISYLLHIEDQDIKVDPITFSDYWGFFWHCKVGIDILEIPQTSDGNCYLVVFVEYPTSGLRYSQLKISIYMIIVKQLPSYQSITLFVDMEFQGITMRWRYQSFVLSHTINLSTYCNVESLMDLLRTSIHVKRLNQWFLNMIYCLPIILNHTCILMNHTISSNSYRKCFVNYYNLILMIINWN